MGTQGPYAQRKQGLLNCHVRLANIPSPSEGHASTFAPARLRGFATGMLAGDSLELRLASECWLRFSPKQNELATSFAFSSPSELI